MADSYCVSNNSHHAGTNGRPQANSAAIIDGKSSSADEPCTMECIDLGSVQGFAAKSNQRHHTCDVQQYSDRSFAKFGTESICRIDTAIHSRHGHTANSIFDYCSSCQLEPPANGSFVYQPIAIFDTFATQCNSTSVALVAEQPSTSIVHAGTGVAIHACTIVQCGDIVESSAIERAQPQPDAARNRQSSTEHLPLIRHRDLSLTHGLVEGFGDRLG